MQPRYGAGMNEDRAKQIARDRYYMKLAEAVQEGANCLGSKVGAIVVLRNRVVSTGYNGTPEDFPNCLDDGCVRCHDSSLFKQGRAAEMSDPSHTSGSALDRCICVHAEQNAFLTAARFGIALDGACLYSTLSPCFGCLKEAVQVGISRIVYKGWYQAEYAPALIAQYKALYGHLSRDNETNFESIGGQRPQIETTGQPDPYAEPPEIAMSLKPPAAAAEDSV